VIATTADLTYVIPVHWTVVLLAIIAVGVGAILGAWWTTRATDDDVAREVDRRVRLEIEHRERTRRRQLTSFDRGSDDDLIVAVALLLRKLGGRVEIGADELIDIDRRPPVVRRTIAVDRNVIILSLTENDR
jgi:hypothetical protein